MGEGRAPEGDPAALPPLPKFAQGWVLGEPDMVVKMPEAYTLHAEGKDVFRCFVIPLNLDEDKYVTAVDFRPGNPKIVHHALFFLDATGKARELDAKDPEPGYPRAGGPGFLPTGGLGGWSPGYMAPLPAGRRRAGDARRGRTWSSRSTCTPAARRSASSRCSACTSRRPRRPR